MEQDRTPHVQSHQHNWRGSLTSHEVIVNLIANTTRKGLKIHVELDTGCYPTGIKVTDQELQDVALEPAVFHGEWNYTIRPRTITVLMCC